jgi:predicted Zn-dependent peptidase
MAFDPDARPSPARAAGRPPRSVAGVRVLRHPTEQANVVLGVPGVARRDDRRYALGVLNTALGGGMSSRLFQEVREKRGLAYSVYSYSEQYADTGVFGLYAGCLPKKVDEVLRVCVGELESIAEHGITQAELERGQGMLRGGLVLGLEDTSSRMNRLGKSEVAYGELLSIDDLLGRVAAVTLDDVRAVAADLLSAPRTLTVMGPFAEDRVFAVA